MQEISPTNSERKFLTSQENSEVRNQSIPLIYYDQKQGFKVSKQAETFLKSIKGRLGVIGVAGKYRTGKSFLLNRVILSKIQEGFGVGPTINPCTKGLWIWGEPMKGKTKDGQDITILVIDSEGIGSMNQDHNHDTRIFLLTLLLSSFFIFNSTGTIDENALQNLSLIVNLTKQLQIRSQVNQENDPQQIARYFPNFLWVVRDFALQLKDLQGNSISAKQYFQSALNQQKGSSDSIQAKNRIRKLIKLFFKERDCFTMVRPTQDQKQLQNLQRLPDQRLRPQFMQQIYHLRNKIFIKVKPKSMNGKFVNGAMLLELAHSYVNAINKGSVPCIQNAWTYVCKNECERAIQSVGDVEDFENVLRDSIESKFKDFKTRFYKIQREKIQTQAVQELSSLDQKIRNGFYNNIVQFQQDLQTIKSKILKSNEGLSGLAQEILHQMCQKMVIKAADYITRTSETQTNNKMRQIQQKYHQLEKEFYNFKNQSEREIEKYQHTISELEKQNQKNERILAEKQELQQRMTKKLRKFENDAESRQQQWMSKMRENDQDSHKRQYQSLQKITQLQKQNALMEQKSEFLSRDSDDLKRKFEKVERELKDSQSSFKAKEIQFSELKSKQLLRENEFKQEVEALKSQYEDLMEQEKAKGGDQLSELQQKKFEQMQNQRKLLQEQFNFAKQQGDQNKRIHQTLMQALNRDKRQEEKYQNIVEMNKTLATAMNKVESRNGELVQKIDRLKRFQRMIKFSASLQCRFCQKFFPSQVFSAHLSVCTNDGLTSSKKAITYLPLHIQILRTQIREDDEKNRYSEFVIQISVNGQYKWEVYRKYKLFTQLNETLMHYFPNVQFPQFSSISQMKSVDDVKRNGNVIEDRRKLLEQFLSELSKTPIIRGSSYYKKFLQIDTHIPEEGQNSYADLLQPSNDFYFKQQ